MALFGRDRGRIEADQKHALAHPVRFRIWSLFTLEKDRLLTARALHPDLTKEDEFRDVTVSQVNYHVARLKDAQLLPAG
jgi:hypothetical protein